MLLSDNLLCSAAQKSLDASGSVLNVAFQVTFALSVFLLTFFRRRRFIEKPHTKLLDVITERTTALIQGNSPPWSNAKCISGNVR
jgi:hypothetical protein